MVNGTMPDYEVTIERINDLELLDFAAIVSLERPRARLLPLLKY